MLMVRNSVSVASILVVISLAQATTGPSQAQVKPGRAGPPPRAAPAPHFAAPVARSIPAPPAPPRVSRRSEPHRRALRHRPVRASPHRPVHTSRHRPVHTSRHRPVRTSRHHRVRTSLHRRVRTSLHRPVRHRSPHRCARYNVRSVPTNVHNNYNSDWNNEHNAGDWDVQNNAICKGCRGSRNSASSARKCANRCAND